MTLRSILRSEANNLRGIRKLSKIVAAVFVGLCCEIRFTTVRVLDFDLSLVSHRSAGNVFDTTIFDVDNRFFNTSRRPFRVGIVQRHNIAC